MVELILEGVAIVAAFIVGVGVGVSGDPTVTRAIAAVKKAEQSAQATLAQITAHKAS